MGETGNKGKTTDDAKPGTWRTEFVIVFIWKEPTPSDALRGVEDAGGGSSTSTSTPAAGTTAPVSGTK